MKNLQEKFLNEENFYLAFKKLSHFLKQSNEWYNPIEISTYEANLATNINRLIRLIEDQKYTPHHIEPLPFPKKNSKDNQTRVRPYYKIHIEDQLIWIAISNIIGSFMESKMPNWSYGNRLFIPVWYEDEDGKSTLKKGGYFNTSKNYYRKWNQSWPFYRRHIAMTIKIMAMTSKFKASDLNDDVEKKILIEEEENNFGNYKYLDKKFWSGKSTKKLYWAGLDYERFFPSLSPQIIIQNIKLNVVRASGEPRDDTDLLFTLIEKMLKFPVDNTGWIEGESSEGSKVEDEFYGVPTGLVVGGFLANIGMMSVDEVINKYIEDNRNVAVFKFVDDQIILSSSRKHLLSFLNFYNDLLLESNTGVNIQTEKISPERVFDYDKKKGFRIRPNTSPSLDVNFPEPLMTHTLQKMSVLNCEDYELLDIDELKNSEADLEHFLLADFPDEEMKKETRMSFASLKLCQLATQIRPDFKKIDSSYPVNINQAIAEYNDVGNKGKSTSQKEIGNILTKNLKVNFEKEIAIVNGRFSKIFKLLLKAAAENPDKLKLWKRLIEFCYISGSNNIKDIFQTIRKLNFHESGKQYIIAFCLTQLYEKISQASNDISGDYSSWKAYKSRNFLKFVKKIKIDKNISTKPFILQTQNNFGLINHFLNCKNNSELLNVNNFNMLNNDETLSFEAFLWFFLSVVNNKQKLTTWENNVKSIDFSNRISWSIISLFPSNIPSEIIPIIIERRKQSKKEDFIHEDYEFRTAANGVIYEMLRARPSLIKMYRKDFSIISDLIDNEIENYLPLNIWLEKVKVSTSKMKWIDVRLSEWTLLEIIKQISEALKTEKDKGNIFDSKAYLQKIHPVNYLVPQEWLTEDMGWKQWKDIVNNHKIKLNSKQDLLIEDFRYLPVSTLWRSSGYNWIFGLGDISLIIGLSVLMTQLLAKSFEWPSYANKLSFIDQLFSKAISTVETTTISSSSRKLISQIFSKKDIEILGTHSIQIDDQIHINNLEDFLREIGKIQIKLANNHLVLLNNAPRQLTIIDIEELNKAKQIF